MARSYLFIPGNVPRMLQNMDVFDADAIIVDFEDAVAVRDKDEARHLTSVFLAGHFPKTCAVYVRVNAELLWLEEDLRAIKDLPLNGIVLPKTDSDTLKLISDLYKKLGIVFPIIGIIETPKAFFHLETIFAHPHVVGTILGGEDLRKNVGFKRSDTALAYPRTTLLYAASAFNKLAIDTPCTTLKTSALHRDITAAKTLGYAAKCAIHPNHVPDINAHFTPSEAEILEALRIVKQYEKTESMRFTLDGKMIDKPIIIAAQKTLARAESYGMKVGDSDAS